MGLKAHDHLQEDDEQPLLKLFLRWIFDSCYGQAATWHAEERPMRPDEDREAEYLGFSILLAFVVVALVVLSSLGCAALRELRSDDTKSLKRRKHTQSTDQTDEKNSHSLASNTFDADGLAPRGAYRRKKRESAKVG
eukprot:SAG31_NODE_3842_length_3824_cov_1.823356_2_plen_137_part_00